MNGLQDYKTLMMMGTPFSGSTLLGNALNGHSQIFVAGELDRLPQFKQFEHLVTNEPDIYVRGCFVCRSRSEACPVWTQAEIERLTREPPSFEIHAELARVSAAPVVVDCSKNVKWFSTLMNNSAATGMRDPARQRLIAHCVRHPFGFALSWRRHTGQPPWRGAEVWRDINTDVVRQLNGTASTHLVVQYELFALDPKLVLSRVCNALDLQFEEQMMEFWKVPLHSFGGNVGAYLFYNAEIQADDRWQPGMRAHRGRRFGGYVDDRWRRELSVTDVASIMRTPGVADLASLLGYDLVTLLAD